MFHWLFPTWSDPAFLTGVVGVRVLLNLGLVAVASSAAGRRSALTITEAVLTLVSAVLTVLVLRPDALGLSASYVEFVVQLAIVGIAGYAVYSNRSASRPVAFVLVSLGALALTLLMIPLYGEALVAP